MRVPDAWDECGACCHDRDDHRAAGCDVGTFHLSHGGWRPCECRGFQDEVTG